MEFVLVTIVGVFCLSVITAIGAYAIKEALNQATEPEGKEKKGSHDNAEF